MVFNTTSEEVKVYLDDKTKAIVAAIDAIESLPTKNISLCCEETANQVKKLAKAIVKNALDLTK